MLNIKKLIEKSRLPETEAVLLATHALRKPKEWVFAHLDYEPNGWQRLVFFYYSWRWRHDYSIAAITGHKEFFGLDFFVNKHVLIPRPDTEILVGEVLRVLTTDYRLQSTVDDNAVVCSPSSIVLVDVGTGSGCIPIAIAKNIPTALQIYAIDISRPALRVAKKNARTHKVFINFLHGNLLEPFLKNYELLAKNYKLIITANLPYLTPEQFAAEPSIRREPRLALVGGKTGLELYEKLLEQISRLTTDYRLQTTATNTTAVVRSPSTVVMLEIDPSQSPLITPLVKKYLPVAQIEIKQDLAGANRVVLVEF